MILDALNFVSLSKRLSRPSVLRFYFDSHPGTRERLEVLSQTDHEGGKEPNTVVLRLETGREVY